MKWIMCTHVVGGPHDGEIHCEVKDIPDEDREQIEPSFDLVRKITPGLIVWEEYDPDKDYPGAIYFVDSLSPEQQDEIDRTLENNSIEWDTTVANVKEIKKE